mmetsp:Transcript_97255/g.279950  ORF Transcript_97255/g.279950 Transcript_97255/m.279950 type:complete len:398 (+) Transcript_97255:110-1303(+)
MSVEVDRALALSVTLGLFVAIAVILRSRGPRIVTLACLFVGFLVATQLIMKELCGEGLKYKFPGFVTICHFMCVVIICFCYWTFWMREPWRLLPSSIGSERYLRNVVLIAVSQPISVIFNNKAMVYVGAGVVAIIGTLAPVATAVLSRVFGRALSFTSWGGVFTAFAGGVVVSWSEVTQVSVGDSDSAAVTTGLVFAFSAVLGRAAKIVLIDFLLSPEEYKNEKEAISPLHLYALQFPLATAISIVYASFTENAREAWEQLTPEIAMVIGASCFCATMLNFIGLHVLKELGASAQQIIGKLNTICIASLSVAFLGEHIPMAVAIGSGLVLLGVAIFESGNRHVEDAESEGDDSDGDSDSTSLECGLDSNAVLKEVMAVQQGIMLDHGAEPAKKKLPG